VTGWPARARGGNGILTNCAGTDVWGKTLGIIGFGRIGRAWHGARRDFALRLIYYSTTRAAAEVERELNAEYMERDRVLQQADFLSLHVPLRADTRGLIGPAELVKMKRTAFPDQHDPRASRAEAALVACSRSKARSRAQRSTFFEREPLISEGLRREMSSSRRIRIGVHRNAHAVAMIAVENVSLFSAAKRPPTILNPEVLRHQ